MGGYSRPHTVAVRVKVEVRELLTAAFVTLAITTRSEYAYILACRRDRAESAPNSKPRDLIRTVPISGGQLGQRWYVHDRPPAAPVAAEPYEIGVLF